MTNIRNTAANHHKKAKARSKRYYDRRARPQQFKEGEYAYVIKEPRLSKFDPHYIGPYKIVDVSDLHNVVLSTDNRKLITKHQDKLKHAFHPDDSSESE